MNRHVCVRAGITDVDVDACFELRSGLPRKPRLSLSPKKQPTATYHWAIFCKYHGEGSRNRHNTDEETNTDTDTDTTRNDKTPSHEAHTIKIVR